MKGFKSVLAERFPDTSPELLPSSFEVVGDICIIEMKDEIRELWKPIAEFIVERFRNINSVWLKASERKGEYRTRELVHLAGEHRSETLHRENGCMFSVDVRTCYFSQREVTERQRILEFISAGDRTMTLFAGVGPFPICIAKHTAAAASDGVEINPRAVEHFRRNIRLNKVSNARAYLADVKKFRAETEYEHVFMPLPGSAVEFLPDALGMLSPGGTVHLYFFSESPDRHAGLLESIGGTIKDEQKVLPYGPGIWKWRVSASFSEPRKAAAKARQELPAILQSLSGKQPPGSGRT